MRKSMKISLLTLLFYVSYSCTGLAKNSIQLKLLEPFELNGAEHIIKGETTVDNKTVQILGKGKGSYSKGSGAISTMALTHILLPGKKGSVSALKQPSLTSFKTKTNSFKEGQILTLTLDSKELKEAIAKVENGETTTEVSTTPDLTYSSERRVSGSDPYAHLGTSGLKDSHPGDKGSLTLQKRRQFGRGSRQGAEYSNSSLREGNSAYETKNNSSGSDSEETSSQSGRRSGWANPHLKTTREDGLRGRKKDKKEESKPHSPVITTDVTAEGCTPTIDKVHHRVIIQKRTLTKEDGKVTNSGKCEDTLENYPIERDYKGEGCKDIISLEEKVVYPQYKSYWLTQEAQKVYIDNSPQVDRENPYSFVEEEGTCPYDIDYEGGRAFPQLRLIYLDRWNTKQEIRTCSKVPNHQGYPLQWTKEGCSLIHEFENNRSRETHKAVFQVDSTIHEAKKCEATGDWLEHQFVPAQCKPLVNLEGKSITPTARRQVRTLQGVHFITEECEPLKTSALQQTRKGCEGDYVHDWISGKSYLKKRYYYANNVSKEFVSGCLRTDEFVEHEIKPVGYKHDDLAKVSYPKTEIWIEEKGSKVRIAPAQIMEKLPVDYKFIREETRISKGEGVQDDCFWMQPIYRVALFERGDGSLFKIKEKTLDLHKTYNCTKVTEYKDTVNTIMNNFLQGGDYVRSISTQRYKRDVIYFATGEIKSASQWEKCTG